MNPLSLRVFRENSSLSPSIEAAAKIFLWLWGLATIILLYIYVYNGRIWCTLIFSTCSYGATFTSRVFLTHQVGTGLTQRLFDEVVGPSCNSKQCRLKRHVNFQYQFLFGKMIFHIKLKAFHIFDDLVVFLLPASWGPAMLSYAGGRFFSNEIKESHPTSDPKIPLGWWILWQSFFWAWSSDIWPWG